MHYKEGVKLLSTLGGVGDGHQDLVLVYQVVHDLLHDLLVLHQLVLTGDVVDLFLEIPVDDIRSLGGAVTVPTLPLGLGLLLPYVVDQHEAHLVVLFVCEFKGFLGGFIGLGGLSLHCFFGFFFLDIIIIKINIRLIDPVMKI